jgi:DNA-binding NtrC family response regulator
VASILLIDDDDALRDYLEKELTARGHEVVALDSAEEGIDRLTGDQDRFDVIVLDYMMPRLNGLEFLAHIRSKEIQVPVVLMTSSRAFVTVIEAGRLGVVKYIVKPVESPKLVAPLEAGIKAVLERAGESARSPNVLFPPRETGAPPGKHEPVGTSESMLAVGHLIGRYADSSHPVLIWGETGTGKELVAHAIHGESPRKTRPFVAVNCGAIAPGLADSQFFGHMKGAFTGADRDHIGYFERADGGTLFLDEIGDLPLDLQVKLLRVLQEGRFERVGGTRSITVDVRVLAATHRDLRKRAQEGTFREDLYNRLDGFLIHVPPLRERLDDLPALVDCILEREARTGRHRPEVAEAAMDRLRAYHWPGNIRELENVVTRAFRVCQGSQILPSDLGSLADTGVKPATGTREEAVAGLQKAIAWAFKEGGPNVWDDLHELLSKELVKAALAQCRNNKSEAAKRLGKVWNTVDKYQKKDEPKE